MYNVSPEFQATKISGTYNSYYCRFYWYIYCKPCIEKLFLMKNSILNHVFSKNTQLSITDYKLQQISQYAFLTEVDIQKQGALNHGISVQSQFYILQSFAASKIIIQATSSLVL